MKTQVLYKSRTGNTEKLAKAIFAAVPGSDKDIARLDGRQTMIWRTFILSVSGQTEEAPA